MRPSGSLRATLASRGFRRLLGVRVISQLSDGLFQAGLIGNLLFSPERRPSPLAVATGFAILLVPYSIIGPYVGVFLDRWYRTNVLYATNLLRALLILPAAGLVWLDLGESAFALFALAIIAINRFFLSGLSAALPHVVATPRLVTANAVATTLGTVAYSVGLGTVGVATGLHVLHPGPHGYALAALIGAIGYGCSAVLSRTSFTRTELGPDETQRRTDAVLAAVVDVARGMVAGVRHLVSRRRAASAMLAQSLYRILYGILAISTLVLYRRYFYPDDAAAALSGLAWVVTAGGVGSLVAAFLTPPLSRRLGPRLWLVCLFGGVGVVIAVLGLLFQPAALVLAVFLINVASQGTKIVVDTTLQQQCEDIYRGRVFSVNDTTFNVAFVTGLYLGAVILPPNGRSPVIVIVVALGYELLALWYGLVTRRPVGHPPTDVPVPAIR